MLYFYLNPCESTHDICVESSRTWISHDVWLRITKTGGAKVEHQCCFYTSKMRTVKRMEDTGPNLLQMKRILITLIVTQVRTGCYTGKRTCIPAVQTNHRCFLLQEHFACDKVFLHCGTTECAFKLCSIINLFLKSGIFPIHNSLFLETLLFLLNEIIVHNYCNSGSCRIVLMVR